MIKLPFKRLIFSAITELIGIIVLPHVTMAQLNTNSSPSPSNVVSPAKPFPLSSTISYESLRIMAYSGQTEQAIKLAEEYLKHNENASIRVLLGRMLAWNKEYDAAREQLQFVLSKHPGDFDASDTLADVEVWTGNYNRAIAILDNALKYDPNNQQIIEKREIIRARMFIAAGERNKAIQLAENYLKSNDTLNMRIFLGTQLGIAKQFDAARKNLEYVLLKKPSSTDASIALAEVEISSGNYHRAIEIINNGLNYSPKNNQLLQNKTLVLEKLQSPTKMGSINQNTGPSTITISNNQTASSISYDELNKMSRSKKRQQAIKLAQESLKQSDNSDIRTLLGLMLSWEGRYSEARVQLTQVFKAHPNHLDATKGLANVELWSGNDKKALVVINTGLKYHPKDSELLKQKDRALGLSSESLSYDALRNLARSGQSEKAKKIAQEYLNKNENTDIRLLLGLMHSWDKEYDQARTQLQTVLRNKPGYTDASLALANIEIYTENYQRALQVINKALEYDPKDKSLLEKRAAIVQDLNEYGLPPGAFNLLGGFGAVTPYAMGKKLHAVFIDQDITYVDDLKQIWKITSIGYERYTSLGPIIFRLNKTDRFNALGTQYMVEAYPHLFKGAYMYLGYGYSDTSYLARNYIGFEPFFSLPNAYEFSIGERILQFQDSITHLYTGSIGKYIGNYWFSFRPYFSNSASRSYYLTARRYFSTPDSYISLTIGGGSGPSNFDDPEDISDDLSRTVRLNGQVPLTDSLIFNWLLKYSYSHYPNTNIRQETDVAGGLTYLF